jgi:sulfite reductase (NADPH) hemoprotein beta-component
MWRAPTCGGLRPRWSRSASHAANSNLITDIIACPGLDYCALANARSISVAQENIQALRRSLERQRDIGELKLKISGCINACGHHHVGHIGILGVEKKGAELYQVTLGGSGDESTSTIGEIIGRGFGPDEITDRDEKIVDTYLVPSVPTETKNSSTRIVALGPAPFKEALYAHMSCQSSTSPPRTPATPSS